MNEIVDEGLKWNTPLIDLSLNEVNFATPWLTLTYWSSNKHLYVELKPPVQSSL